MLAVAKDSCNELSKQHEQTIHLCYKTQEGESIPAESNHEKAQEEKDTTHQFRFLTEKHKSAL